jgi:predicted PurR-regulated permease PerM
MAASVRSMRITTRSVLILFALLGAGLVARNVVQRSERVIGWFLAAAIVAALAYPVVTWLQRWMRRPFAVLVVFTLLALLVGGVTYGVIDDVSSEVQRLRRAAPAAAERIESSERFGQVATDFQLADRVRDLVDQLPGQLAGGSPAEAVRATATRSVAYLATTVLTIFLLLHGARLANGALQLQRDEQRRLRLRRRLQVAYGRWWRYVVGSILISMLVGVVAAAAASLADLPGPVALGLAAGVVALVPMVGVVLGAVPILLLSAGSQPWGITVILAIGAVALQLVESQALRRRLEHRSVHVGPAVTFAVAIVALELGGIGAVFVGLALTVFGAAVLAQVPDADPSPDAASGSEPVPTGGEG